LRKPASTCPLMELVCLGSKNFRRIEKARAQSANTEREGGGRSIMITVRINPWVVVATPSRVKRGSHPCVRAKRVVGEE